MNIRVLSADALTPAQLAAWADMQRADAALASPYFRPEFTQAVSAVRHGVEVGVWEEHGKPVGFFPFQRGRGNVGRPVGGMLSDFHGLIARPNLAWDPRHLLRACGLSAWHFHQLPAAGAWAAYHWSVAPSPHLDLSHGWEGYQAGQLAVHAISFKRAIQKLRHAQREGGPLRVELHTTRPGVFQSLVQWKIDQYRRTGVTNVLAFPWTVALLERIRTAEGEGFSGMMSALYMGDVLAAVLLSLRSYGVLHAWFSAYRPDLAPLSPGLILWLELARLCPASGVRRLDLGKGHEEYKQHLMSGAIDVAEGSVDLRPVHRVVRRQCRRAYDWARLSPLRRPLLVPGRILRSMIEARSLRP